MRHCLSHCVTMPQSPHASHLMLLQFQSIELHSTHGTCATGPQTWEIIFTKHTVTTANWEWILHDLEFQREAEPQRNLATPPHNKGCYLEILVCDSISLSGQIIFKEYNSYRIHKIWMQDNITYQKSYILIYEFIHIFLCRNWYDFLDLNW